MYPAHWSSVTAGGGGMSFGQRAFAAVDRIGFPVQPAISADTAM